MRRGFTILELLVASLLLGMLVTILTMIFNQSSIAWRTGVAGLLDMDEVRDNIAAVRDEADCLYVWNDKLHRTLSVWKESNSGTPQLRKRAVDSEDNSDVETRERIQFLEQKSASLTREPTDIKEMYGPISARQSAAQSGKNWIVNVKSNGPNRTTTDGVGDYDDILSMPDDFD